MKRTKGIVLLVFILMLSSVLAACSSNSGGGSTNGNTGTNGGGNSGGSITELTLWHMEEPPNRVARFKEVIDKFNASHPDIKITPQVQSWADAYSKFPAAIQAGNGPDLLFTIPDYTTLIKQLGVVQPVDDIIASINEKHGLLDTSLAPYTYEGHTWAVPLYGMVQVLWYRADLLKEAGITPPTNWDELKSAAEKLTGGGKYGIALPASKSMATDQVLYSFLVTAGAKNIINGSNVVTFNNEKTVAAYQMYKDLLKFSPPDSNTYQWGEPQAQFNTGAAAMAIEKGQYLSTFESESGRPAEDLGVVPMPVASGGEQGSIYYSNGVMMLTDNAAKKAAIAKFFEYLFEPETYGSFVNAEPGLFLPVTEDGSKAESFWNDPVISKYRSQVEVLIQASNNGALFGFTDGVSPKIGQIAGPNYMAQTLEQMNSNGLSAEKAVSWGQAQMEEAVK
ncbi:ABC transporter substrate-binding protein [Paenibacillus sp. SYP-B4298]|uniref:ABC transporter substrate-binding protein n=1 Tax=Paenibacillus sp. SYP-B4298 TaxID=2996034 RepID=UPI0022DCE85A|nr:sugar ABC transporter substrate-binding protein [Paenibacillus sp. SYP-B4298]